MQPRSRPRLALGAGALCLATAAPAHAQDATSAQLGVSSKRLNVKVGSRAAVSGRAQAPAGSTAALQILRHGRWITLDRDRTSVRGRFRLHRRLRRPLSSRARVRLSGGATRSLGRLNVYRSALASWYGPGLYGRRTGCGGTLSPGRLGVANKWLPCGARVTLRYRGRVVRVPVIDRGPYSGLREFDLTAATAHRLRFRGHHAILVTR